MSSEERSRQVDGIYPLYSDSLYPRHNQPITLLTTIGTLLSQPTGRPKDPPQYQYHCIVSLSQFSQPPMLMNPCSMFRFFLCHDCVLLHILFAIKTTLLTVSPTLVPLLTHSLLLSIFKLLVCALILPLTHWYITRIGCTDCLSSFNIIGYSSPLLPCRLADLRRGLIYSENFWHQFSCSLSTPCIYPDCTSATDLPFHRFERSLRPTSSPRNSHFAIEFKPLSGSWSLLGL